MKIKSLNIVVGSIMFIFTMGCSQDILNENPPQLISTESLYTSLAGFEAGLNGLYASLRDEYETPTDIEMPACIYLSGNDNMVSNHKAGAGFNLISQVWGDANNPQAPFYFDTFSWLYGIINAANTIVNQAEDRTNVDWSGGGVAESENQNRVIAEAKAVRAWAYRHLSYGWGDVPLSLEESLGSNIRTDWERSPRVEVRRQIISDLLFAEKYIPVQPSMQGRITKGAVQTFLAEMYLVFKKPDSAFYWSDKVINTPEYKLITERYGVNKSKPGVTIMDMFTEGNENRNKGNTEALWVWQFAVNVQGGGENLSRRFHGSRYYDWVFKGVKPLTVTYERGGRGKSRQSLSKWAIDLYEPLDERGSNYAIRKFFVLNDAAANAPYAADKLPAGYNYGDTIWFPWDVDLSPAHSQIMNWPWSRKADGGNPDDLSADERWNNIIYLRLAETYFLKAEAQYLLGDPQGAANTINIIRRRSKASDIGAADISIDFILDERSRELVFEEHRRWTLLRTGKWLERVRKYNKNGGQLVTERDTIFPLPQVVIDANLTAPMSQNPGWN